MGSFDLTRHQLALGSVDSTTGWYAKSYTDHTIEGSIQPRGAVIQGLPCGNVAIYDSTLFTEDPIVVGDMVTDAGGTDYLLELLDLWWMGDSFSHYVGRVTQEPLNISRPTTSGSAASVDDPRKRVKVFLDYYLDAGHALGTSYHHYLTEDDGSTEAAYLVQWAGPDYPMRSLFSTKGRDVVFSVGFPETTVDRVGYTGYVKSYLEATPIWVHVVDKSGITAATLLWKAEWVLRKLVETYPPPRTSGYVQTYRSVNRVRVSDERVGGFRIHGVEFTMNYMRDTT